METFNVEQLKQFYCNRKFRNFYLIKPERKTELDMIAALLRDDFLQKCENNGNFLNIVTAKLTTSARLFGLNNDDEILYVYVLIVDPNLEYLKIYESSNKVHELKKRTIKFLGIFDPNLLGLEKIFNKRFHVVSEEDYWQEIDYLINMASPNEKNL